jgi:hypothetical protein
VPQASAGAAELAAAQARSSSQLQALESQLASKDAALDASQVRLAALEAELKGTHSKVRVPLLRHWSDITCYTPLPCLATYLLAALQQDIIPLTTFKGLHIVLGS